MDIRKKSRYVSKQEIDKAITQPREYIASENLIAGQLAIIDSRSGFLKSARVQDPSDLCISVTQDIYADSIAIVDNGKAYALANPDLEADKSNSVNALCKAAFQNSKEKGFYESDSKRNFGEFIALVHSELSEALEHQRKGSGDVFLVGANADCDGDSSDDEFKCLETLSVRHDAKPDGVLIELADAVIRIFDYCGSKNWNLESAIKLKMAYNKSRPYKHGKRF